jgi:hypothetical protein
MPMLTPSQVHVDTPLTNLTVAYMQSMDGFVADKVFPNVPVDKKTNKFYIYNREDFNRTGNVKVRAPRTRPERVGMSLSSDTYSIAEYSLATDFDFETLANEDTMLNIRSAGASMLTMQMMIHREALWADTYFKAGVWTTDWTGVANADNDTAIEFTQWDDYTNSTPILDVTNAKRTAQLASGGFIPNVGVMTRDVFDVLVNHPDILARLNGGATVTDTALVTQAKLAEILGLSRLVISDAIQNTGKEGLAEAMSFINTKKFGMFYTPSAPGLMVPAAGYNFTWASLSNASGYGIEIKSYADDTLRREGIAEELHAIMAYDMKVVGADMGVHFASVLA